MHHPRKTLAIIGSGASAIYLLKHVVDHLDALKTLLHSITLYEKQGILGMGMPYNRTAFSAPSTSRSRCRWSSVEHPL